MGKTQNGILRPDKIIYLRKVFEQKNWSETTATGNNEFDDFCSMLTCFDDSQQDLILSLTEDFLQVNVMQYAPLFFDAYRSLLPDIAGRFTKILIQPLLAPKDFNKQKSSTTLFYFVKSEEVALKRESGKFEVKLIDNHEALMKNGVEADTLLCLIDDYVGTGETAESAVNFLVKKGVPINNICVISLVAQCAARDRLNESNIPLYCSIMRHRGLSDNKKYLPDDKKTMAKIESKMGIKKKFKFGYGQSEALIRLMRIPNNTFPVYWYPWSKDVPTVPFPRKG